MQISKLFLMCLAVLFFSSSIATSGFALSFTKVGKAEEKIIEAQNLAKNGLNDQSAERLKQAESLLVEALADSPKDHEAQNLLGRCYWLQGDEGRAIKLFKNAAEDSTIRSKAIEFLKAEENNANASGDFRRSLRIYDYAVDIDPSQKTRIVDKLGADADNLLKAGKYELAQIYYQSLIRFEPPVQELAYKAFFQAGNDNTVPRTRIYLYRLALGFGNEGTQAIIDSVAAIAKTQDRKLVEPEIKRFPSEVSEQIMTVVWPPNFKYYHPRKNTYPFLMKKGEITEHFIHVTSNCDIRSNNKQYEIITRNGQIIKVWAGEEIPTNLGEFKIKAVADTFVALKVGNE